MTNNNDQNPESPKVSILNDDFTPPQKDPNSPKEQPKVCSKQGGSESSEIVQGRHQELQGLLNQAQAVEEEASHGVDVQALRKLFEGVPQLGGGTLQAPIAPHKTSTSMEQAFGELTRVSTEVAHLKEQTLARLLDIEEAVHKALNSMSSLQSEAHTKSHLQRTPQDPSVHNKVSVSTSSRARPIGSGQVKDLILVKNQGKVESHSEEQGQAKIRSHTEARGQAASGALPTRQLETPNKDSGLQQVSPSFGGSPSTTFISIQSATKKLLEASSPQEHHYISGKSTHLAQARDQALLFQREIQDQARTTESVIKGSVPTGQQKHALELQAGPASPTSYGATRTVTEQYEEMDQFGNTVLTSSTTITQQAEPLMEPSPQLRIHTSPLLRQFLHSPSSFNSDLAGVEKAWVPSSPFQPAPQ